ncbi:endospore germination permease [Paenibacillus sp. CF384]|uniref:GerAB/ArcD/ProY family transporter n=1 Tax=Paenibacillus sp. CF384 TaxID=1884382 RepID=UPI000897E96D|nr:endospore germination permease [Paenibacillus sp. CF384]SDW13865.1 spore germination protein (amino acid permease) [Paenibacillus sp. CF384]
MKQEKISSFQLGCLCFAFMSGFSTLYLLEAKCLTQDVWISNILATIAVILTLVISSHIQKQFPQKNFGDIIIILLGKWIGKVLLTIFMIDLVGLGVLSVRSIALFYTSAILPNTSPNLIMLIVFIVTIYAVSLGIGTIVRSVLVILPFFIISIIVIGIFIYRDVEYNPFLPQFQHPINMYVYGTMISFGFPFGKSGVMAFLFSDVSNPKKVLLSCSVSVTFSCLYLLISTYLAFGCLGTTMFKTASFPFFSSIQLVKFGEYIERIEILIIGIWTIFTLFEIIIVQYVFVKILGRVFELKNTKSFIIPAGILFFAVAIKSFLLPTDLITYDINILPFTIIMPVVIVPIVLLVLTWLKMRKSGIRPV